MPKKKMETGDPALNYRSAAIAQRADGPATYDDETRSVEVVAATETPSIVYDWDRGVINEILLMSGAQIPETRQMVLLDAHQRFSTAAVIGSVRDLRVEGGSLTGRAYFSSVDEAQGPAVKVKEGHLTDFSVGYRVLEAVWVPEGKTTKIDGREYQGPVQVTTKWQPRELSTVPIGADQNAKARSEITADNKEETQMDKRIRAFLERSGLPATATDEEAYAFLDGMGKTEERQDVDLEKVRAEATGTERDRIRDIDAITKKYGCEEMARASILDGTGIDKVREAIMVKLYERADKANPGYSGMVYLVADERDKARAAMQDSLLIRAGFDVATPAPGSGDLRGYSLVELAREALRMSGENTGGRALEMVGRAMTTSDFPYLLANVATKALEAGFNAAEETWPIWTGEGSVSDFKTYYGVRVSEASDLDEVPEGAEFKYGERSEGREAYDVATYGKLYAITRQAIINDDLGGLTDAARVNGEAAQRKIGDVAYAVLTANGNMGDGKSLFHSDHGNDAVSGYLAAPGIATLNEAFRAMGVQKDLQGLRRLNLRPAYLLAPRSLEGLTEQFFKSEKYSDYNTAATDSMAASTRANIYAGNVLTRVYESRLDDDDLAQWYLAAAKGKAVKVVFLNGVKTPFLEMQKGWTVDGVEYKVRIDAGAYAVDWRGLYRNAGD